MQKLRVIAISRELNSANEIDIYIYKHNRIYLYSPGNSLQVEWEYEEKIREIAMQVDKGIFDWVDIFIDNGQKISREGERVLVDNVRVKTFSKLSKQDFAKIGPVTSKIYNEFIRSNSTEEKGLKKLLKEVFSEGFFTTKIADIIEYKFEYPMDETDLNNLDKQIIIRVKIEGYQFIINFIKNIMASGVKNSIEYCEKFMSRVFMLESQNFIKVETNSIFTI